MKLAADFLKRFYRNYSDVVGVDVGTTATKLVRLRKGKEGITAVSAGLLPSVCDPETPGVPVATPTPLDLPRPLRARYASLAVPGRNAVVKLLNVPAQGEKAGDLPLHDLLGLTDDAHYRIGYEILGPGTSRSDSRLLAVAVPEAQAQAVCRLFPSGTPAPCSMEIAGLAVMTAFQHGPGGACAGECVGIVDFGASVSVLAIFNRGVLVLIRKFDFGTEAILKRVQESLGVDAETAQGILADGSFDVSQVAREVMAGFTQQLIISRDFVERRENCRMRKLYASGGVVGARDWQAEVQATVGLVPEPWNPFEGLSLAPGAVPDTLRGMEPRFAAAVGAALGSLEAE